MLRIIINQCKKKLVGEYLTRWLRSAKVDWHKSNVLVFPLPPSEKNVQRNLITAAKV